MFFPSVPLGEYWIIIWSPKDPSSIKPYLTVQKHIHPSFFGFHNTSAKPLPGHLRGFVPYLLANVSAHTTCSRTERVSFFVMIFRVPFPHFLPGSNSASPPGYLAMSRDDFVPIWGSGSATRIQWVERRDMSLNTTYTVPYNKELSGSKCYYPWGCETGLS